MNAPHPSDAELADRFARLKRFFNSRDRLCRLLGIAVTEIGHGWATAAMSAKACEGESPVGLKASSARRLIDLASVPAVKNRQRCTRSLDLAIISP